MRWRKTFDVAHFWFAWQDRVESGILESKSPDCSLLASFEVSEGVTDVERIGLDRKGRKWKS